MVEECRKPLGMLAAQIRDQLFAEGQIEQRQTRATRRVAEQAAQVVEDAIRRTTEENDIRVATEAPLWRARPAACARGRQRCDGSAAQRCSRKVAEPLQQRQRAMGTAGALPAWARLRLLGSAGGRGTLTRLGRCEISALSKADLRRRASVGKRDGSRDSAR
jgi:hypothetical protein